MLGPVGLEWEEGAAREVVERQREPGLEEGLWARLGGWDISPVAWHSFDRVSCCPAEKGPEDQT